MLNLIYVKTKTKDKMENFMKNKLILIFVIIVLIFVMGDNCYANSEKITKDLELNSYSSSNG